MCREGAGRCKVLASLRPLGLGQAGDTPDGQALLWNLQRLRTEPNFPPNSKTWVFTFASIAYLAHSCKVSISIKV